VIDEYNRDLVSPDAIQPPKKRRRKLSREQIKVPDAMAN